MKIRGLKLASHETSDVNLLKLNFLNGLANLSKLPQAEKVNLLKLTYFILL